MVRVAVDMVLQINWRSDDGDSDLGGLPVHWGGEVEARYEAQRSFWRMRGRLETRLSA